MELDLQFKYYVIHFLEQPYHDIEEYICVPQSWIRSSTRSDQTRMYVAYPSENSITTKDMVKTRRKAETEWEFYLAVMRYGTDYYHDARSFIILKGSTVSKKNKTSKKRKGDKMKPEVRKSHSPKQSTPSYTVKSHKHNPNSPLRVSLKKPESPRDNLKTLTIKLPRIDEKIKSLSKVSNPESIQGSLTKDQLLSILEDSSDMHPQEISVSTSLLVNAVVDKACNQGNTNKETNPNPVNTTSLECSNQDQQPAPSVGKKSDLIVIDQRLYNTGDNAMSASATNQPCQLSEHSKNNTSAVQKWPVSETITERSKESNDIAREAYLKGIKNNTTAPNPVDESGHTSKYFQENQCSLDCRGTSQLQLQEMITRRPNYSNNEGNVGFQTQNFPSIQNYPNGTNLFPQTSEDACKTTSYKIDAPVFYPEKHDPRASIQKVSEANRSVDQRPTISYGAQSISEAQNFENIMYQHTPFLPHAKVLPASINYPRQDLHITRIQNKISTEAEKVPQQNIKKNQPMLQNIPNAGNHSCRSSECCEKHFSPTLKLCLLQDQPVQKNDGKTTGGNSMDSRANFPVNTHYTPSVPYHLQANQFDQSLLRSKEAPPAEENYLLQNPQQTLHSGLLEMNGTHQRAYPQSIPQVPSTLQNSSNGAYQCCYPYKYSYDKQSATIASDHNNQNPQLRESLVVQDKGNSIGQPVYQSNTEKILLTSEEVPSNTVNRSSEEQLKPMHVSSDKVQSRAEEIPTEVRNNVNGLGQSSPATVTEDTATAVQSSPNDIDIISPDFRAAVQQLLEEQFTKMFKKLHLSAVQEIHDEKYQTLMNYNKLLEEVIDNLSKCCELANCNATASAPKENQGESKKLKNKRMTRKIKKPSRYVIDDDEEDNGNNGPTDEDNHDGDDEEGDGDNGPTDDEDDHDDAAKKEHQHRNLVLPPEYNPVNSKWTLKYHRAVPGLTELLPASRVYVNSIMLAKCKRSSKDHNSFARLLLTEIFTENALRVCSLTGARAQAYHDAPLRPGLDRNARTVLITYVDLHGREMHWGPFDVELVLRSIRSKIQDIRDKWELSLQKTAKQRHLHN